MNRARNSGWGICPKFTVNLQPFRSIYIACILCEPNNDFFARVRPKAKQGMSLNTIDIYLRRKIFGVLRLRNETNESKRFCFFFISPRGLESCFRLC